MSKVAKVAKEYFCESCNYKCSNKTNFEKHLATAKHKIASRDIETYGPFESPIQKNLISIECFV